MKNIENFMQKEANRQLLKYAAGRAVFCPNCSAIMDYRRTVVTTIKGIKQGETESSDLKVYTTCKKCFKGKAGDTLRSVVSSMQAKYPASQISLEVIQE